MCTINFSSLCTDTVRKVGASSHCKLPNLSEQEDTVAELTVTVAVADTRCNMVTGHEPRYTVENGNAATSCPVATNGAGEYPALV